MCDISPCGGGRCFVAVSAHGDLFPCSEFIGFPEYRGGNLYEDDLNAVLESPPFKEITTRKVEDIAPCASCAIRHFCGAPCPAEVRVVSKTVKAPSPLGALKATVPSHAAFDNAALIYRGSCASGCGQTYWA